MVDTFHGDTHCFAAQFEGWYDLSRRSLSTHATRIGKALQRPKPAECVIIGELGDRKRNARQGLCSRSDTEDSRSIASKCASAQA